MIHGPQPYAIPGLKENFLQYRDTRILITISEVICEEFNVSIHDLEKPCQKRDIVIPRSTWLCAMREFTPLSLERIGQIGGLKDHATVLHAVKRIRRKWLKDAYWGPRIERVFNRLENLASVGILEENENTEEKPPD